MTNYCIVFFPETQDSEVLQNSSIINRSFNVGSHATVIWKDKKPYDAKILFIESEADCDSNIPFATTTEMSRNRFFSVLEAPAPKIRIILTPAAQNISPKITSAGPNTTSVLFEIEKFRNMFQRNLIRHHTLEEIMLRQINLESRCTRSSHVEDMICNQLDGVQKSCDMTAGTIQDL